MGAKQAMQQEMTGAGEEISGHRHVSMKRSGSGVRGARAQTMPPRARVSPTEEPPPKDPHQPT